MTRDPTPLPDAIGAPKTLGANPTALQQFSANIAYVLRSNLLTAFAALIFVLLMLAALLGPQIAPYDPLATSAATLNPPSWAHWFGTDHLGRDVLSRVIVATRVDLGIAVLAVAISFLLGLTIGSAAGYFGGWTDRLTGRFVDTIMAFPLFVLAMAIVSALGNTIWNIVLATAIINLPFYIRFARAEVNMRRDAGYVEAARLGGNSATRILAIHLVPNILPPMMVQVSLNLGWAILNAAGLSFIGLGVRSPTPEWGIMVSEGANYIFSGEWWVFCFPGAALVLTVFCFNLLGDGLRDILDPKGRT
jgi:peptide/nickel transport system permease protein